MKKGFTIILGFAVGLAAVTFAQVIVQRPQFPQTGLSYVGYGDAFPTTELFGGELFVDVNGQTDAGPLFGMYDDVNTVWDIFFSGIGTQNTVVKFGAAELVDSSITDDAVDVVATGGLLTVGTAVDAADSILIDGNNDSIVFEGGTDDGAEITFLAVDPDTDLVITLDNPPADTGGTWMELAAALAAQDAGDVWRGIYLNLDSPADHDGAAEIRGIELNSDLNTATGQEYALWINDRWDTEIWFEGNDANVVFPNTGNLTFNDAGGAHTFILDDVPAAGASDDTWSLVEIAAGLVALDAGDVQNGMFINLANAAHTGGNVYGLNIDGIVQAAAAEEAAIFIGATWDADIHFGSATAMMWWFETGNLTIQDYAGDMQFILEDVPAAGNGADLMELDVALSAMDGGDTFRAEFIDVTTAAHTGFVNKLIGLEFDSFTADINVDEIGIVIEDGWENSVQAAGRMLLRESFEQPHLIFEEDYTNANARNNADTSINTVLGSPSGIIEYREELAKTASSWIIADGDLDISADNGAVNNEGVEIILGDDDDATEGWLVSQTDTLCFTVNATTTLIAGTDQFVIGWRTSEAFLDGAALAAYTTFAYVGQTNIDGSVFMFVDDGDSANDDSGVNIANGSTNNYKVCMEADGGAAAYLNGTEIANTNTTGQLIAAGTNMYPFVSYLCVNGTDAAILIHYWEVTGT